LTRSDAKAIRSSNPKGESVGNGGGGGALVPFSRGGSIAPLSRGSMGEIKRVTPVQRLRVGSRELLGLGEYKIPIQKCKADLTQTRQALEDTQKRVLQYSERATALSRSLAENDVSLRRQELTIANLTAELGQCRSTSGATTVCVREVDDTELKALRQESAELRETLADLRSETRSCIRLDTVKNARSAMSELRDLYPSLVDSATDAATLERATARERERQRVAWVKSLDVGDRICGFEILPPFLFADNDIKRRQTSDRDDPTRNVGRGAYVGEGTYGVVFLVYDRRAETTRKLDFIDWEGISAGKRENFVRLDRVRAIKFVVSDRSDAELSAHMLVEGVLMQALVHPNLMHSEIVKTSCNVQRAKSASRGKEDDAEEEEEEEGNDKKGGSKSQTPDGVVMIVMPFAITLEEWMQKHPDEAENRAVMVRVMREIHCGLQHLWKNQVAHRDVKPANIMMLERGTNVPAVAGLTFRPVVTDFGSAKHYFRRQALSTAIGTLVYMAPELLLSDRLLRQADGDTEIPPEPRLGFQALVAADMWALGCVYWWLLFAQTDVFAPLPEEIEIWTDPRNNVPRQLVTRFSIYTNIVVALLNTPPPPFFVAWTAIHGIALPPPPPPPTDESRVPHVWQSLINAVEGRTADEDETKPLTQLFDGKVPRDNADTKGLEVLFDGLFRWETGDSESEGESEIKSERRRRRHRERKVDFSGFDGPPPPPFWNTLSDGSLVSPFTCRISKQLRSVTGKPPSIGKSQSSSSSSSSSSSTYGPIVFRNTHIPGIGPKIVDAANDVIYRYLCASGEDVTEAATDVWLHLAAFLIGAKLYNKTTRGYIIRMLKKATPKIQGNLTSEEQEVYTPLQQWSSLTDDQRDTVNAKEKQILDTIAWKPEGGTFVCNALEETRPLKPTVL
jgi:serine/threonine protein kinase